MRYNCSIMDLHDRSIVVSTIEHYITSDLAIRIVQKALDPNRLSKKNLFCNSDQGSPYTSKAFIEFCKSIHVTQGMSNAG